VAEEGAEEGERAEGGRLVGLLPDFRPLSMWWQAGSPASVDGSAVPPSEAREDAVVMESSDSSVPAEATRPAKPPTSGWIRRKRKSDDIRPGRENEDAALAEVSEDAVEEKKEEEEAEEGLTRKKRRTVGHAHDHDAEEPEREAQAKEEQSSDDDRAAPLEARPAASDRDMEAEVVAVALGEATNELPPSGDEDVAVLQAMFEGVEEDELRKVLREHGGDVNQAIDSLLNLIAIRNGEAGSLPMDHREEPEVEARDEMHTEASHRDNVNSEDPGEDLGLDIAHDMELGENEERIVDTMKGTLFFRGPSFDVDPSLCLQCSTALSGQMSSWRPWLSLICGKRASPAKTLWKKNKKKRYIMTECATACLLNLCAYLGDVRARSG